MPLLDLAIFSRGLFTINLSKVANSAGNKTKMIKVAQKVPKEIA